VFEELKTCTENCTVSLAYKEAVPGDRVTETGGVRLTVAELDLVGSAALVAVTVRVVKVENEAGAV
jgi:hypothetical protein